MTITKKLVLGLAGDGCGGGGDGGGGADGMVVVVVGLKVLVAVAVVTITKNNSSTWLSNDSSVVIREWCGVWLLKVFLG